MGDEVAARLLAGLRPWACRGVARDQLITLTEGVLVHEERGDPVPQLMQALVRDGLGDGQGGRVEGLQRLLLLKRSRFTRADFDFRVLAVNRLGFGDRDLLARVGHFVDDRLHREQLDLAVLGIEFRLQLFVFGLVVLARRRQHGFFHRLDHDLGLDALFLGERLDGLLQRIRCRHQNSTSNLARLISRSGSFINFLPSDSNSTSSPSIPLTRPENAVWRCTGSDVTIFAQRPAKRR